MNNIDVDTLTDSLKNIFYLAYKMNRGVFPRKTVKEFADELGEIVWEFEKRYQDELK